MELDYHKDLKIDENKLNVEWQEQPLKYKMYSDAWADAENERVIAKDTLAQTRALEYKKLKDNPPTDDKGKPQKLTVKDFDALLDINEKIMESQKQYNITIYNSNILKNSKEAFEQRKKALEKMVDLFGMQYFGRPKNNNDRQEIVMPEHARTGLRKRVKPF